jgi:starch phosphorylase
VTAGCAIWTRLRELEPLADDVEFQSQWREVKLANKRRLAALIAERTGIVVDPGSLFDVQVKRIHEYKRQHLAVLHILTLYLRLRRDPKANVPRAVASSEARLRRVTSSPSASSN